MLMMQKKLSKLFKLCSLLIAPKAIIGAISCMGLIVFSLFLYGVSVQTALEQIKTYNNSSFSIIEKKNELTHKDSLINTSIYNSFFLNDLVETPIKCDSYLRLNSVQYSTNLISGTDLNGLQENEVIISKNISKKYNLKVGDELKCDFSLQKGQLIYKVKGITSSLCGLEKYDSSLDGVIFTGDNEKFSSQGNQTYLNFLRSDEKSIYTKDILTKDSLIKKTIQNVLLDFVLLTFFIFAGICIKNLFFFWTTFDYLQFLKKAGGRFYINRLRLFNGISYTLSFIFVLITVCILSFFSTISWIFLLSFFLITIFDFSLYWLNKFLLRRIESQ